MTRFAVEEYVNSLLVEGDPFHSCLCLTRPDRMLNLFLDDNVTVLVVDGRALL